MNHELSLRIAGEAGQGVQTVGPALCTIFKRCGFHLFAHQDYMSRIRGGNNYFQIRISSNPLYTLRQKADIVVALDKASVAIHKKDLSAKGVIILDKKKFNITDNDRAFFDAPMYDLAIKIGGSEMFINSVSYGLLIGVINIEFKWAEQILKEIFSDKGEEIIRKNIEAAKAGFDFARNNFKQKIFEIKNNINKETLLMNGNEAIALGAIKAGCKFYSGYPMSPSTNIMNNLAHYAKKFNIVVEQAEDEIAAINMVIGASFAGARAMTASSGGGFALMAEGVSLAGMTETPIVVVDAQRPAPATGFPTRTEQADLEFVLHAGHGEFARAIFSPGTIEEAFYLTIKAFNLAEKYQIPVFILTDQHLGDSYRNINMLDLNKIKVEQYILSKEESKTVTNYKRYQLTESGISPRAIPSWIEDVIYVDSDEHTEEGHITEDGEIRIQMVKKRFHKKMAGLSQKIEPPVALNIKNAHTVILGFGSTFGVIKEAVELNPKDKIGFIHLPQVWPFPSQKITELLKKAKKIITVENNAAGQLAKLLRRETGIKADNSILKFDGRPFDLDLLLQKLKEIK